MTGPRKRRRGLLDIEPARPPGPARRNPWPRCPGCFHRVPALCVTAPEGAQPCGFGLDCGCCYGPHRPPRPPREDREES